MRIFSSQLCHSGDCRFLFLRTFRKKVPKTFQPKLRFGELDDVRVGCRFYWFDCEALVVCDNSTKCDK